MKFFIYYQSQTLAEQQGGLSARFLIEKTSSSGICCMAQAYAKMLSLTLKERVACVVCDSEDIVTNYFQASGDIIIEPSSYARSIYVGSKAMLENGRFYLER